MKEKDLNKKLDLILENQKKILSNEKKILKEEGRIEEMELQELEEEKKYEKGEKDVLRELQDLENQLKKTSSPIKKITKRDMIKGFIGAFIGVVGHFAFAKAAEIAVDLSMLRATILYIVAFIVIIVMLYYAGFRKVEKHIVLKFMPLRALILYTVSIITIILVDLLFGKLSFPIAFGELYTLVGANILLAVIGAGTADLIGRNEE